VNSKPHIGHLYTTALAEADIKWRKFYENKTTLFSTGCDEHGLKVWQAAKHNKMLPQQFCDQVSKKFIDLFDSYNIEYDDFVKTSQSRHKQTVTEVWKLLEENGHLYKGYYEGWYCTSDEAFLTEKQVVINNGKHISTVSGQQVEWIKEENYMFNLSKFVPDIKKWLSKSVIFPTLYQDQVFSTLDNFNDLSVSRPKSRVPWGINVPNDPNHVIYVWVDALSSYLTAAGFPDKDSFSKVWPPDVHFIGLDILKFHAVYWPAFLLACGLSLPKKIVVHSHWLYEGLKMSKSRGNVVDPVIAGEHYTNVGMKYFLLRQSHLETNCSFYNKRVVEVINGDLSNDMGNTLNRALAKRINPNQKYPFFDLEIYKDTSKFSKEDIEFINIIRLLPSKVEKAANKYNYQDALFHIIDATRKANLVITRNTLWKNENPSEVETKIYCVYEGLRVCSILLQPFCQEIAVKALDKLGIPNDMRNWEYAKKNFLPIDGLEDVLSGQKLPKNKNVLFKTISLPDIKTKIGN